MNGIRYSERRKFAVRKGTEGERKGGLRETRKRALPKESKTKRKQSEDKKKKKRGSVKLVYGIIWEYEKAQGRSDKSVNISGDDALRNRRRGSSFEEVIVNSSVHERVEGGKGNRKVGLFEGERGNFKQVRKTSEVKVCRISRRAFLNWQRGAGGGNTKAEEEHLRRTVGVKRRSKQGRKGIGWKGEGNESRTIRFVVLLDENECGALERESKKHGEKYIYFFQKQEKNEDDKNRRKNTVRSYDEISIATQVGTLLKRK